MLGRPSKIKLNLKGSIQDQPLHIYLLSSTNIFFVYIATSTVNTIAIIKNKILAISFISISEFVISLYVYFVTNMYKYLGINVINNMPDIVNAFSDTYSFIFSFRALSSLVPIIYSVTTANVRHNEQFIYRIYSP